jgi:hypothetical protein
LINRTTSGIIDRDETMDDNTSNRNTDNVLEGIIGPMEVGYILFTLPFIILCGVLVLLVIFS